MVNKDDVSKEVKTAILKQKISQLKNTLYDFEIQVRVLEKVKDENMKKQALKEMEKFEKMKDEYELILSELEAE